MATTIHALAYKVSMDTRQFTQGAIATRAELREGAKLTDKYRTSMERAEIELKRLATLHQKGAISTATYRREVDRLDKEFKSVNKSAAQVGGKIGGLGALRFAAGGALALIATGKLAHGLTESVKEMDALIKQSKRIGISTADLVRVQYAASLATTMSSEQVSQALQEMQKRLGEAKQETGEAARGWYALNLQYKDVAKLTVAQQMVKIADALSKVNDQQRELFALDKIGGDQFVQMYTMLKQNGKELERVMRQADALGLTWGEGVNKQIEDTNDAMTMLGNTFTGISRTLVTEFAPNIQMVALAIMDIALRIKEIGNSPMWAWGQAMNIARKTAVGTAVALPQAANDFRGITRGAAMGAAGIMSSTAGGASPVVPIMQANLAELRAIRSNQETNNRADSNQPQLQ